VEVGELSGPRSLLSLSLSLRFLRGRDAERSEDGARSELG